MAALEEIEEDHAIGAPVDVAEESAPCDAEGTPSGKQMALF
jgi:hypothetical protein